MVSSKKLEMWAYVPLYRSALHAQTYGTFGWSSVLTAPRQSQAQKLQPSSSSNCSHDRCEMMSRYPAIDRQHHFKRSSACDRVLIIA